MNLDMYHRVLAGENLAAAMPPRAVWKLSGPDAERYLNGQVTNDVTRLPDGHSIYAAVCTAKGRMDGDLYIAKHGGDFHLDADPALRESLGARLEKFLIADDAVLEDITESWRVLHRFGPAPADLKDGFAIANSRFGIAGHDLWAPIGSGVGASDAPVGEDILETLRLENGMPKWGAELTPNTLPPEAGPHMLAGISYSKGCYVGQETIARLKSVGHVNKTLVFLRSATAEFPPVGAKLTLDGKETGAITSSGFSPRLEKGIALAYVQRQHATDGTSLQAGALNLTIAPSLANAKT